MIAHDVRAIVELSGREMNDRRPFGTEHGLITMVTSEAMRSMPEMLKGRSLENRKTSGVNVKETLVYVSMNAISNARIIATRISATTFCVR